jgi:hypothetical protein
MPNFVYEMFVGTDREDPDSWDRTEIYARTRNAFIRYLLQEWLYHDVSMTGIVGFLRSEPRGSVQHPPAADADHVDVPADITDENVDDQPNKRLYPLADAVMEKIYKNPVAEKLFLVAIADQIRIVTEEPCDYDPDEDVDDPRVEPWTVGTATPPYRATWIRVPDGSDDD